MTQVHKRRRASLIEYRFLLTMIWYLRGAHREGNAMNVQGKAATNRGVLGFIFLTGVAI